MEIYEWQVVLKYLILGLVQGFTEPIPVSSSGHVIIGQRLLGIEQKGLQFEILTNTASLIAICFIYREDLKRLVVHAVKFIRTRNSEYKSDFMFVVYVAAGTVPAAVLGLLFSDLIADYFTSIHTIAVTLLITGTALWLIRNFQGRKRDGDLSFKDASIVGLAQAVALVPGISRSGSTVIASIAVGMKQDTALRFSFLLYIPVSLGGMILGFFEYTRGPGLEGLAVPYLAAFFAALIMTYAAMKWFMGIMARGNLKYFAFYCYAAGILLLIYGPHFL
ncbi:UDP pyrophosphate phosphatase [Bacillus mangrovi]|uniref:Undecaprenyl-diphosphatase n=1 Tax=Metabacillus mangrovi TaxID=1491830 RepID=A0A7X2S685_9BACI|nr:undecaprenyl-diphosphate phosphatase [Metabacillus mangrovi]MTH54377.1 UDP pyrophosphate phosphatase [Metabacillus mangrovi]